MRPPGPDDQGRAAHNWKSGERLDDVRASIFDALAKFDKPAAPMTSPSGVEGGGRRVAANVYRILDLFVGANLARRVELERLYRQRASRLPARLHLRSATAAARPLRIDDDKIASMSRPRRRRRLHAGPAGDRAGKCSDARTA